MTRLKKTLAALGLIVYEDPCVRQKWDELLRLQRNGTTTTDDYHGEARSENGAIVHVDWHHEERRTGP